MTDVVFTLRIARVNAGLSQRGLADKVGVGLETIRRLEDGKGAHPENAKRVADFFGVQVTDVIPMEQAA